MTSTLKGKSLFIPWLAAALCPVLKLLLVILLLLDLTATVKFLTVYHILLRYSITKAKQAAAKHAQ